MGSEGGTHTNTHRDREREREVVRDRRGEDTQTYT